MAVNIIEAPQKLQKPRIWTYVMWVIMFAVLFLATTNTDVFAQTRGIALKAKKQKTPTPFVNGTYRALLIGNNTYRDPQGRWPNLKTAVSDARAVKNVLQTTYGFTDVQILENATRREILNALSGLSKRVMPKDSVLLYYAGHGFIDIDTNKGYWVPVDAEGLDQTTFLRNSTIRDELSTIASRVQHTLLISDSCFSGTLLRSATRSISPQINSDRYYRKVAQKKSVQILAAGGLEYVDDDYKASGHSPFTYFLLSELKNNNQPLITASELSATVEKSVANNVNQVPESGVLQGAGDELGEFIFLKIKIDVKVEGVPKDKVTVEVNVTPDSSKETKIEPVIITTIKTPKEPVQPKRDVEQQPGKKQKPPASMDILSFPPPTL